MKHLLFFLLIVFLPLLASGSTIIKLEIKGVIGPASSNYLKKGIEAALDKNTQMVLIELNTPGGLSSSMREMILEVTNSTLPVIIYVSPRGARDASTGIYLLYASHVAAMAPGTNLGAATPVNLIPVSKMTDVNSSTSSSLEKKALNDAIAYIKSLAELSERNVSWAIEAAEEAKSISAKEALRYGVIEIIAEDTNELLAKMDGRSVIVSGKQTILSSKGALIEAFDADWKTFASTADKSLPVNRGYLGSTRLILFFCDTFIGPMFFATIIFQPAISTAIDRFTKPLKVECFFFGKHPVAKTFMESKPFLDISVRLFHCSLETSSSK